MRKNFTKVASKTLKTMAALVLSAVVAVSSFGAVATKAAVRTNTEPFKYTKEIQDDSTTVVGKKSTIYVNTFCEKIKLSGSSKAIKKINKTLKKAVNEYDPENIISNAEELADEMDMYDGATFSDTNVATITYRDDKYISVLISRYWFAGGVTNHIAYGYVFSAKTGKKVSITKAIGMNMNEIKKKLLANKDYADVIEADKDFFAGVFGSLKESDINFYINEEGKAVVVLNPYEYELGNFYAELVLE